MKKLLLLYFIFTIHCCFSQTEKPIKGIVLCDDSPVQGIEVVNLVTEKTAITNSEGVFLIAAKEEDMLVFISKKHYYKRLFLEKEDFKRNSLRITLTQKPEELEEVIITKAPLKSKGFYSQAAADEINLEKANRPKPIGVYDGVILNSPDFIRIGKMILAVFNKKKEDKKESHAKIEFKELTKTNFEEEFFINSLKLKPEEIVLFLEYCDADPKSKTVLENSNPLLLLDFLLIKNKEFKNLK